MAVEEAVEVDAVGGAVEAEADAIGGAVEVDTAGEGVDAGTVDTKEPTNHSKAMADVEGADMVVLALIILIKPITVKLKV